MYKKFLLFKEKYRIHKNDTFIRITIFIITSCILYLMLIYREKYILLEKVKVIPSINNSKNIFSV